MLIAGPTAVGKSEVALLLAQRIGAELISVDSMQVYRGLDIGTAKPSLAERERVPHHLIDIIGLKEAFDAAQFVRQAEHAMREVQNRGRVPVLCGGTGLYFKALLEGLGEAPPANPPVRKELEDTPLTVLLRELAERDPATFERIDRQNPRRVIRALEVIRLTGKPFSAQRTPRQTTLARAMPLFFGLSRAATDLHGRIEARVDEMFQRGLVSETEQLLPRGLAGNPTALQALGYRQAVEFLHGERSLPDTIALVKVRTRQYAKRQMTWFRRQAQLHWIELQPDVRAEDVATRLAEAYEQVQAVRGNEGR